MHNVIYSYAMTIQYCTTQYVLCIVIIVHCTLYTLCILCTGFNSILVQGGKDKGHRRRAKLRGGLYPGCLGEGFDFQMGDVGRKLTDWASPDGGCMHM